MPNEKLIERAHAAVGSLWARDPLEALCGIGLLRSITDKREAALINRARKQGASWAVIGSALGRSRQAVQQKYGRGAAETAPGLDSTY